MSESKEDLHLLVLFEDQAKTALFDLVDLTMEAGGPVGSVAERVVDGELDSFERFMQSIGNEGLARAERAILKTYLAWKLGVGQEQEKDAG
jgi:hypothetical protein